ISDAPSAFDDRADRWMVLPELELLKRADVRIGVVERGDEPERDLAAGLVVEEAAAPGVALRERPALGMDHPAGLMSFGGNLPHLLDSQTIDLRFGLGFEIKTRLDPLRQVAARALR